jgi:hypothetical protein
MDGERSEVLSLFFGAPGMARSVKDDAGQPVSESEAGSDQEVKVLWGPW